MDLFRGLTSAQAESIRRVGERREFKLGEEIFAEGEAARSLYVIESGSVKIYRKTANSETTIRLLGPGETFGELGLAIKAGLRTAYARAMTPTTTMEIPGSPMSFFRRFDNPELSWKLIENLICLLGERLRSKDMAAPVDAEPIFGLPQRGRAGMDTALDTVKEALPQKGLFRKHVDERTLEPGQALCKHGDAPDGFYFIHYGVIEAAAEPAVGRGRVINKIDAPAVLGELGYFSGERRSATLKALSRVGYTHFTDAAFKKLKETSPEEALNVLFSAAQMAALLIFNKENMRRV